ncbi:alpha/beta hydrolase [Antrihabitans cavernicola]|uniref:Alpha/beta hydrolase n=1 Tax=Antrihabitans cavernicola TaxID=2495913 RepID=A0A5A7SGT4_9NOCA|nr:alpha/beta hydrolase [Spelaeibacter cavernicola]KAA0023421.1 alpha/beta hydrolase [Spelaeibacter cavernicola]
MTRRFLFRQAANLALTVNAVRPVPGMTASLPVFFAGWLTSELAPQLLAATALDASVHVARRGLGDRSDRLGVAAAGASAIGLAAMTVSARRAGTEVEDALTEGLGPDYREVADLPGRTAEALPLRKLAMPFHVRRPDVVRHRNLAYAEGGKRFAVDIFHHRDMPSNAPLLLEIHGGGWVTSNKDHQALPLMVEMASRGWVCASINYPLSPKAKWPDQPIAVKRAITWFKEHAGEYGGTPEFLAITGGSAGGHLAALAALTPNDPSVQPGFESADTSVQACVPMYAPTDMANETGLKSVRLRSESFLMPMVFGKGAKFPDDYLVASPYAKVRADAPPFFVVHGSNDSLVPVPESRAFVEHLRSVSRNPVAYAELKGAQHAFDVFASLRSIEVLNGVTRFLEWSRVHARSTERVAVGS